MNGKQIGLGLVLADFTALTAYAVYEVGYVGFFDALFSNIVGITIFVDLCIALSLVMVWMYRDARQRGESALPYIVATLLLGSVGPLAYLIRRESAAATASTPLRVSSRVSA
jgi:hypothetical protein